MRIALVSPYFRKNTGVGRYLVELAKTLSKENEVTIITNAWESELEGIIRIIKIPKLKRFSVLSGFLFTVISHLKLLSGRFDIVHGEITSTIKHDVLVAHACFKYQLGLLLQSAKGDLGFKVFRLLNPRNLVVLMLEGINYRLRNYKRLVAVSPQVKRQLSKVYRIPSEEIIVIPNGVNINDFCASENEHMVRSNLRSQFHLNQGDIIIIFVGNDFKIKGLDSLLRALPLLPESLRVLVAGSGNKSFSIEMGKSIISKLKLQNRVYFLGQVRNISDLYHSSDIFTLLSLDDACPLSVLEAMSCGLPVVMSKGVGIAEMFVSGEECIIVQNPANIKEVAEAFNLLLDHNKRSDMAHKGQLRAQEFSWESVANQMLEVYSSFGNRRYDEILSRGAFVNPFQLHK